MLENILPYWWKKEAAALKEMSPRQRLDHLWHYYKLYFMLFLGFVLILAGVFAAWRENSKEILISGLFLNTDTSAEGYAYVSDGYLEHRGGDTSCRADVIETMMITFSKTETDTETGDKLTQVDALIATYSLDYMLLDETALDYYGPLEAFLDLSTILTEEQLQALQDRLVTVYGLENQAAYIAAIDLTGTTFAQRFGLSAAPSYFAVVANTPRPEAISAFLDYLLAEEGA